MTPLMALLLSMPAQALKCPSPSVGATLPERGADGVALNVRPTLSLENTDSLEWLELSLVDGDGALVPTEEVVLSWGQPVIVQLRPLEELDADRDYRVQVYDWMEEEPLRDTRFTTGSSLDLEAPAPARAQSVEWERERGGPWGDVHETLIRVAGGGEPGGAMVRIELSEDRSFAGAVERVRLERPVRLLDSACSYDEAARVDAEDMWVRVTTLDAAGNESASTVHAPQGGCQQVSARQLGWLAVLVGFIGALRRSI